MFVGSDRKIVVDRIQLLDALKANLKTHMCELALATTAWEEALHEFACDLNERVQVGDYTNLSFDIAKPQDSSKEISRAIAMVEMSVPENITLDEHTFNQWVMGEWSFRSRLAEIGMMASAMSGSLRKK